MPEVLGSERWSTCPWLGLGSGSTCPWLGLGLGSTCPRLGLGLGSGSTCPWLGLGLGHWLDGLPQVRAGLRYRVRRRVGALGCHLPVDEHKVPRLTQQRHKAQGVGSRPRGNLALSRWPLVRGLPVRVKARARARARAGARAHLLHEQPRHRVLDVCGHSRRGSVCAVRRAEGIVDVDRSATRVDDRMGEGGLVLLLLTVRLMGLGLGVGVRVRVQG